MAAMLVAALLLLPGAAANMYDVVMPAYLPPAGCAACRPWTSKDAALWANATALSQAGSSCAMPAAKLTGHDKKTPEGAYKGPWCYCKATGKAGTCVAPKSTPEQINLQLAEPTVVVVSFVTYDLAAPTSPPVAMLEGGDLDAPKSIEGVSHMYFDPPNKRNYTMSFVRFSGLASRGSYTCEYVQASVLLTAAAAPLLAVASAASSAAGSSITSLFLRLPPVPTTA